MLWTVRTTYFPVLYSTHLHSVHKGSQLLPLPCPSMSMSTSCMDVSSITPYFFWLPLSEEQTASCYLLFITCRWYCLGNRSCTFRPFSWSFSLFVDGAPSLEVKKSMADLPHLNDSYARRTPSKRLPKMD